MLTGLCALLPATLLHPAVGVPRSVETGGAPRGEAELGEAELPMDLEEWVPLDDPDLARLPKALRLLPHTPRAAFESKEAPWLLLARRVPDAGGFGDTIAEDEEVFSKEGEFVPTDEEYFRIRGDEALFLDCEWKAGETAMKLAGLYAPASEGQLTVLWIAAPADASSKQLLAELKACYRSLKTSFDAWEADAYHAYLNGHEIAFSLRSGRGNEAVSLVSAPEPAASDRVFFDKIVEVNEGFVAGIPRAWHDEDRGVTLSLLTFQTDQSLGPMEPFITWIAGQFQAFVRKDKDLGDAPVEWIHLEDARCAVVSEEEVQRHYANNERAPDAGVILQTFIPRSPYARVCRIRFQEKDDPRHSLALFCELITYPRSRSETVARTCVLMLLFRAQDPEDLRLLEDELAFRSSPLTDAPPLAELER